MPRAKTRAASEPAATSDLLKEDQAEPILLKLSCLKLLDNVSIAWPLLLPIASTP